MLQSFSCQINFSVAWDNQIFLHYMSCICYQSNRKLTMCATKVGIYICGDNIQFIGIMHACTISLSPITPTFNYTFSLHYPYIRITTLIGNLRLNVMYPLENLQYYVKNSSNMQLSFCMSHCHIIYIMYSKLHQNIYFS